MEESGTEFKTKIFQGVLIGPVLGAIGGAFLIPAMGWLAAGPLLAALQGATLGGATGYLGGVLGGLGFWKEDISDAHQDEIKQGAVLIGVTTQGRAALAEQALHEAGAKSIHRGSKIEAAQDIHLRGKLGEDHQGPISCQSTQDA